MKKIVNFGSLNIDYVYSVEHFVRPGETLAADSMKKFCGGKGSNQSIALARAGAEIYHAGKIGVDGIWMKELLNESGVKTDYLEVSKDTASGHAIIQVNKDGENCIILFGGANQEITSDEIDRTLAKFTKGDIILLQNEINAIPEIMKKASEKGLYIAFNPSPITADMKNYPLELVSCFVLNEIEGAEISGAKASENPEDAIEAISRKFPKADVVMTLGKNGVICKYAGKISRKSSHRVKAVDTTAAGDTFTGFLLASLAADKEIDEALTTASKAAAICVTRNGASVSIPKLDEVLSYKFQE